VAHDSVGQVIVVAKAEVSVREQSPRCFRPKPQSGRTVAEDLPEYASAGDRWLYAVAVVLLQHSEIPVAELIGDLLDRHTCVGHEARRGVSQQVRSPDSVKSGRLHDTAKLVAHGLGVRGASGG
jgi:hypothetical protein